MRDPGVAADGPVGHSVALQELELLEVCWWAQEQGTRLKLLLVSLTQTQYWECLDTPMQVFQESVQSASLHEYPALPRVRQLTLVVAHGNYGLVQAVQEAKPG